MRILYVNSARGHLGDSIRASKVYFFLKKRGFEVHEKWINTKKPRAFVSGLTELRHFLPSRKEYITIGIKSPIQVLVSSFFISIQRQILKEAILVRPNIIVAESSLLGYFSLMAKNNLDIPLITDVQGLMGKESEMSGSRYAQIMSNVEGSAFHGSDYLLAVSNPMKRQICLEHEVQADKILVIPNGGNIQRFQARFSLPLKIIYAGNFAAYEKVSDYLEIAKAVKQTAPFVFFLMGAGVKKREILSRIKKEKIRMKFMGLRTRLEALRIFSNMQVGVVPSTSGLEREVAFPIKMLDYMSCGLPVVAPKIGDWGRLIEKENCGIAVEKNNISEFVNALYVLCDKEEWEKKSIKAKECIERKYNWNAVLEPLSTLIENIAV